MSSHSPPHSRIRTDKAQMSSSAAALRQALLTILTEALAGDDVAAEYLLMHLVSSMYGCSRPASSRRVYVPFAFLPFTLGILHAQSPTRVAKQIILSMPMCGESETHLRCSHSHLCGHLVTTDSHCFGSYDRATLTGKMSLNLKGATTEIVKNVESAMHALLPSCLDVKLTVENLNDSQFVPEQGKCRTVLYSKRIVCFSSASRELSLGMPLAAERHICRTHIRGLDYALHLGVSADKCRHSHTFSSQTPAACG